MSVRIMSEVFERSKTQGNARLVLLSLADSCNDDASCWPSIRKIAEKANISEPITKKYLNALIQIGVITRDEREDFSGRQTSNLYTINVEKIGDDEIPKSVLQQVVSPSRVKSVEGVTKVILGVGNPVQRVEGVTKVSLPIMNHNKEPKIEPSRESSAMASHSSVELNQPNLFSTNPNEGHTSGSATAELKSADGKGTAPHSEAPPRTKKSRESKPVDEKFIAELQRLNPDKDVEREVKAAQTWLLSRPDRKYTRGFLANWVIRSKNIINPDKFHNNNSF
jgi:DNA-binding Lrp family transcriptional regulator